MSRGFRLDPPPPLWFDVVFCLTPPPPEGPRGLCTAPRHFLGESLITTDSGGWKRLFISRFVDNGKCILSCITLLKSQTGVCFVAPFALTLYSKIGRFDFPPIVFYPPSTIAEWCHSRTRHKSLIVSRSRLT